MSNATTELPRGDAKGFVKYLRYDLLSGFMVFLIALPLCLGISIASGYPPMAGIYTAIIGSILTSFISNSELTIKGPAAGLILIALGCIEDFGGHSVFGATVSEDILAYRSALAVGAVAAILQILFGVFRAGILGEFFPKSAIHGMLAAIGVMIIAKQIPVALGVKPDVKEPLQLLSHIPQFIQNANPAIAFVGITSLIILFSWQRIKKAIPAIAAVPPQLVVLVISILIGLYFKLMNDHEYTLFGAMYPLGERFLVPLPTEMFSLFFQIQTPEWSALAELKAWKWIMMFFIIGTLESILSAKAVDSIDPWKRKTNMDRDVLAVAVANLCAALVGGLPMISEIVRSKANIDNGARTRFANMWHGVCLLICVALLPSILHQIPLAALAAMLVFTGFRLAHPSEFAHVLHIGPEQLVIFLTTLITTLATDLLIGIAVGIGVKFIIHAINGVPLNSMFKVYLDIEQVNSNTCRIRAGQSAVFSNWISFKRQLEQVGIVQRQNIILDVSDTKFIDHTVMEKLHEMQQDMTLEGLSLDIVGLESHQALSHHTDAARKRGMARMKRITIVAEASLELLLEQEFIKRGATGFTSLPSRGAGRQNLTDGRMDIKANVRVETIVPYEVCDDIVKFLRDNVMSKHKVTVCIETIEVILPEQFVSTRSESISPH